VAISIFVLFGPKIRFFSGVDVSMLILNHFKTSPSDVQMRILKIRLFARAMMSYVCFAMFHVRVRILICLHVLAHITNSLQRVLPFEKVFGIWTQKRAFSKVRFWDKKKIGRTKRKSMFAKQPFLAPPLFWKFPADQNLVF